VVTEGRDVRLLVESKWSDAAVDTGLRYPAATFLPTLV
jgi:hypothetical protein